MAAIPRWDLLSDQERVEYTGEQCKSLYCSKHAWNPAGPLQSTWNNDIKRQVDLIIAKNYKLVFGRGGVATPLSLHLYLLSPSDDATTAHPTIFILASDKKVASRARKLILNHPLFKNLDTGFEVDYEKRSIFMFLRAGEVEPKDSGQSLPQNTNPDVSSLCGVPVVVTAFPTSQDSRWRSGTVMSVVHAGQQAFAVLPAHLFYPETADDTVAADSNDDDDDSSSDAWSLSPTSDGDDDQTSEDSGYFGSDFSLQNTPHFDSDNSLFSPPAKHCVYINRGQVSAEVDVSSLTFLGHFDPKKAGPSGAEITIVSRGLDYALIAIEDRAFDVPNQTIGLSGETIAIDTCCTDVQDGEVLILSASQGIQSVRLSATAVTIVLPWSLSPQSVWQLEYSLPPGDSGSLVVYPNGSMVGMAFATVPELNITYVMPATDVFQDIRRTLNLLQESTTLNSRGVFSDTEDSWSPSRTPRLGDSKTLPSTKALITAQAQSSIPPTRLPPMDDTLEEQSTRMTSGIESNTSDQGIEKTPSNISCSTPSEDQVRETAPARTSIKDVPNRPGSRLSRVVEVLQTKLQRNSMDNTKASSNFGSSSRSTEESSSSLSLSAAASSVTSTESSEAGEVCNGKFYGLRFPADHHDLVLYEIYRSGRTWEHARLSRSLLSQDELSVKAGWPSKDGPAKLQMAKMSSHRRSIVENLGFVLSGWEPIWIEDVNSVFPSGTDQIGCFQVILKREKTDRLRPTVQKAGSGQVNSRPVFESRSRKTTKTVVTLPSVSYPLVKSYDDRQRSPTEVGRRSRVRNPTDTLERDFYYEPRSLGRYSRERAGGYDTREDDEFAGRRRSRSRSWSRSHDRADHLTRESSQSSLVPPPPPSIPSDPSPGPALRAGDAPYDNARRTVTFEDKIYPSRTSITNPLRLQDGRGWRRARSHDHIAPDPHIMPPPGVLVPFDAMLAKPRLDARQVSSRHRLRPKSLSEEEDVTKTTRQRQETAGPNEPIGGPMVRSKSYTIDDNYLITRKTTAPGGLEPPTWSAEHEERLLWEQKRRLEIQQDQLMKREHQQMLLAEGLDMRRQMLAEELRLRHLRDREQSRHRLQDLDERIHMIAEKRDRDRDRRQHTPIERESSGREGEQGENAADTASARRGLQTMIKDVYC